MTIIRAYGKEKEFIAQSEEKVDTNQTSYFSSIVANRYVLPAGKDDTVPG